MLGLTVRWSLREAPAEVTEELRTYIEMAAHASFTGRSGLRYVTWRMVPGEWFEANHVFTTDAARRDLQAAYSEGSPWTPVSRILGRGPELVEPCEILSAAEGWDGFAPLARF